MGEEIVFVRRASGLIKEIGPWTVMTIGLAYVIADGIYNLTEWQLYEHPGANYPLSLVMGFIMLAFAAFSVVFLTVAMPRTASDYVAISRVLHPLLGYIEAILAWACHVWIVGALAYFQGWYWGSFLIQTGYALHIPEWVSLGEWMSSSVEVGIGLGIFFIVVFSITNILGIRVFKYLVNFLVAVAIIGGIVTVGAGIWGLMMGPGAVKNLWDATYGAGAYEEIVRVATQSGWADYIKSMTGDPNMWGWPGGWSWGPTMAAVVAAAYAFWGMEFSNYLAGEVSRPKKSFLYGVSGAMIFILIYYLLLAVPTLLVYGQFNSYYNYVMYGGRGVDQVSINPVQTPTLAVMLASLVGGVAPWAAMIITFTVAIWVLNGLPVYMIIPSRITFALAFDRFAPKFLADVNRRFSTPHWSILLTMVASIILVFLAAVNPWIYAISVVTMVIIRWLLASWSAMLLPYFRPRAFESGYTGRIAGIPIVSIVGFIGSAFMTWLLTEAIGEVAGDMISFWWLVGWIIFASLLFLAYAAYNKSKGIEVEKIFKEVPPA